MLVVDDNADMREYLASLLDERYAVQLAPDGARALALVRDRPPDLVISDAMMPELDGFGLVAELRADPDTQQLPVIMISARAGEEGTIEGLAAGADDYLIKPFSARELLARVAANLELSRLRRQATEHVDAERRRLEAVLEQLPAGVVLVEAPSGRQMMANRQVSEILGHLPLAEGVDGRREFRGYDLAGRSAAGRALPDRALAAGGRDRPQRGHDLPGHAGPAHRDPRQLGPGARPGRRDHRRGLGVPGRRPRACAPSGCWRPSATRSR